MEEGSLGALDAYGRPLAFGLSFLRSSDSVDGSIPEAGDEITPGLPFALRRHWYQLPKWHRCKSCHLVHYPYDSSGGRDPTNRA